MKYEALNLLDLEHQEIKTRINHNAPNCQSYKKIKNVDPKLEKLISKLDRQFLHAKTLGFVHPKTNEEMIFSSILPQELNILLKMLKNINE